MHVPDLMVRTKSGCELTFGEKPFPLGPVPVVTLVAGREQRGPWPAWDSTAAAAGGLGAVTAVRFSVFPPTNSIFGEWGGNSRAPRRCSLPWGDRE